MRRLLLFAAWAAVLFLNTQAQASASAENSVVSGDRATSQAHWEHMVRQSARNWGEVEEEEEDETADIVDIQAHYRRVFAEGQLGQEWARWGDPERVRESEWSGEESEWKKPVRGRYMVMFASGTSDRTLDRTIETLERANFESGQRIRATDITPIRAVGKGFVATMNSRTLRLMRMHPVVYSTEQDVAFKFSFRESETSSTNEVVWNLDRIDQHENKPDGKYTPEGTGANVDICIVDTGIRYSHSEFEGRAVYAGYDAIDELTGSNLKGRDCYGHGTHTAGTAAGKTFGVAKKAKLLSLRVLSCTGRGSLTGLILGMEYVVKKQKKEGKGRPLVFSLSLDSPRSISVNRAMVGIEKAGYVVVAASGNQHENACEHSPGGAKTVLSVGATDREDRATYFSNAGVCMNLFAPGEEVTSAFYTCDTCTSTLSGTSMSCPHVTGYAAILLGMKPCLTPQEVRNRIIAKSTKNAVDFAALMVPSHTPNRLLYVPKPTAADADSVHTARC